MKMKTVEMLLLLYISAVLTSSEISAMVSIPVSPPDHESVLRVETHEVVTECRVAHFTAVYSGQLTTWTLDTLDTGAGRTLCHDHNNETVISDNINLGAICDTGSTDVFFNTSVSFLPFLRPGDSDPTVVETQPNYPQTLLLDLDTDDDYLVTVEDTGETGDQCMYVGINNDQCPYHETVESVTSSSLWSRVLSRGYFTINKNRFSSGRIALNLVPLEDSSECFSETSPMKHSDKRKMVTVSITKIESSYVLPILSSNLAILLLCIIFFVVWVWCWGQQQRLNTSIRDKHRSLNIDRVMMREDQSSPSDNIVRTRAVSVLVSDLSQDNRKSVLLSQRITADRLNLSHVTELFKHDVYHRRLRSKTYLYLIPLLSLFYLVPSSQMVFHQLKRSKSSGNLEMCYLNYGCSRPWGMFEDFNHIISNSGYIIFGTVFIILVRLKSYFLPAENKTCDDHLGTLGIPQQHSLFYTMGIAMVLQGVFSAIFHTCPSNLSLQFDTTMMYIMLLLVFTKVYQFRHPDISCNAYSIMYGFVTILILEAMSLYVANTTSKILFYSLFSIGYIFYTLYIAVDFYLFGALQTNFPRSILKVKKHLCSCQDSFHFISSKRFIFFFVGVLVNIGILIYTVVRAFKKNSPSLSSPILFILTANVCMIVTNYMIRKTIEICQSDEGEGTFRRKMMRFLSFVFFIMAVLLGMLAGYFYVNKHQSRNRTPAESRNMNELCNFMNFFDNHDLWHFISATALFLSFIFLLTIDDDLLQTQRQNIEVF